MNTSLETRLRRLERARMPSELIGALILQASPDEDVSPRIAAAIEAGTHRPNWPRIVIRTIHRPEEDDGLYGRIAS